MTKSLARIGFLIVAMALVWSLSQPGLTSPSSDGLAEPTPQPGIGDPEAVEQAILQTLTRRQGESLVYSVFQTRVERIAVSTEGVDASAWMALVDPSSGQDVPSEPGLAILRYEDGAWITTLPGDAAWDQWLQEAPPEVISDEEKTFWQELNAVYRAELPLAPISGYRLPWESGRTGYLSGSVSHDAYIPSGNAHFAYDFYMPGSSSSVMFNLFAARAGTVWMFRDSQPDHDESSPGNYLVLQDTSTSPVTYQLYLHLSQNSIPAELRIIGAPVVRGQFIGIADDTGASTGNHVHFQVHTNAASYWGRAVDITFDDVTINGGRPRVKNTLYDDSKYCTWSEDVCVSFQSAYVSGNFKIDPNPPSGGLTGLQTGDVIRAASVVISGWAQDSESGLRGAQVVAAYGGIIHNIGPDFAASPFSFSWDMCLAGVQDGPVSLGLRIFDKQNNLTYLPGLVTITKSYQCSPPSTGDTNPPAVQLMVDDNTVVGGQPFLLQAQAVDAEGGISKVEFFWHSPDWSDPSWFSIGNGIFSAGFWQATFNPAGKLEGPGSAFYALGYDASGNTMGDGAWKILLDTTPPISAVNALAPVQTSNTFLIQSKAQDNLSGVDLIDLQHNINVSTFVNFATNLPSSTHSIWYTGQPATIYAFRVRASDQAGNWEIYPETEDSVTYVPDPATLCSSPDAYEIQNDNSSSQSFQITLDGITGIHNFCNPQEVGFTSDQDWVKVALGAGSQVTLMAFPQIGSAAAPQLTLYSGTAEQLTLVAQAAAPGFGSPAWISFIPAVSGNFYLRVQSTDGTIIGTGTAYSLQVYSGPPRLVWLPAIHR